MQKISTCLFFDGKAEEAMNHYLSIFPDGKVIDVMRTTEAGPGPAGSVLGVTFELLGQEFFGLNGGPMFQFTGAISLFVNCETQAEVDRYWNGLLDGGQPRACGWLVDKFGVYWQIVPTVLPRYLKDPDRTKAARVMAAMMKMIKLDIAAIEAAYAGR